MSAKGRPMVRHWTHGKTMARKDAFSATALNEGYEPPISGRAASFCLVEVRFFPVQLLYRCVPQWLQRCWVSVVKSLRCFQSRMLRDPHLLQARPRPLARS
jgi:hypothetical protein